MSVRELGVSLTVLADFLKISLLLWKVSLEFEDNNLRCPHRGSLAKSGRLVGGALCPIGRLRFPE